MLIRKENLILTYASGEMLHSPTFKVFLNSMEKNIPNADLVILTHDMSLETKVALKTDRDIQIVEVPPGETSFLFRDRHLHFYKYLNEHGHKYKYVLISDSRDVVFQANPFDWIDVLLARYEKIGGYHGFFKHFVALVSEGFKRSANGFACIEHFEFQRDVPMQHLKDDGNRWVCNAGIAMGTPRAMQDYEFLLFTTTMKTIGRCTDQAALNYLLHFLEDDDMYQVSHPSRDNLCLTGEAVKMGSIEPVLSDGKLQNPEGKIYYMVHQWDRLDDLKETILAQYLD